jgi:trans-aconitate 2-methyltransferase
MFKNMPINVAIETVANNYKWINYTKGCEDLFTLKDPDFYYDILNKLATRVELWETSYFHILNSLESLIDFIRTTGLKPYLDRLPLDEMKSEFEQEVLTESKNIINYNRMARFYFHLTDCSLLDISNNLKIIFATKKNT